MRTSGWGRREPVRRSCLGLHLRGFFLALIVRREPIDLANTAEDEMGRAGLDPKFNDVVFIRIAEVRPGCDVVVANEPLSVEIVRLDTAEFKEIRDAE
jgi:hypothetical protein